MASLTVAVGAVALLSLGRWVPFALELGIRGVGCVCYGVYRLALGGPSEEAVREQALRTIVREELRAELGKALK
jgi:hypothetical protein